MPFSFVRGYYFFTGLQRLQLLPKTLLSIPYMACSQRNMAAHFSLRGHFPIETRRLSSPSLVDEEITHDSAQNNNDNEITITIIKNAYHSIDVHPRIEHRQTHTLPSSHSQHAHCSSPPALACSTYLLMDAVAATPPNEASNAAISSSLITTWRCKDSALSR